MEIAGAIVGFVIIVAVMATAIRLLRQPTHRFQGASTPQRDRSFRETMVVWLMGPRE